MHAFAGGVSVKIARGLGDGRLYLCSTWETTVPANAHREPICVSLAGVGGVTQGQVVGRGGGASGTAIPHALQASGGQGIAPTVTTTINPSATTLMVRNLPHRVTLKTFSAELDIIGFAGTWDFLHFPTYRNSGANKGFAFVNFHTNVMAKSFVEDWEGSQRFGMRGRSNISVAEALIQGFDANVRYWDNQSHTKPLILRQRSTAASAASSSAASNVVASPAASIQGSQLSRAPQAQIVPPPEWAVPMPRINPPMPPADAERIWPSPTISSRLHLAGANTTARGSGHIEQRKTIRRASA